MIDYKLSKKEEKVLDALQMQEYKSIRMLVRETGIYNGSVKSILGSLKDKGLADYTKSGLSHFWRAL